MIFWMPIHQNHSSTLILSTCCAFDSGFSVEPQLRIENALGVKSKDVKPDRVEVMVLLDCIGDAKSELTFRKEGVFMRKGIRINSPKKPRLHCTRPFVLPASQEILETL